MHHHQAVNGCAARQQHFCLLRIIILEGGIALQFIQRGCPEEGQHPARSSKHGYMRL